LQFAGLTSKEGRDAKPMKSTETQTEESFYAGQTRILEMVASDAPLPEILKSIVLLMEKQSEGLVCSILVLSADGIHVQHGAAPSLPEVYVKAVNGAPIGVIGGRWPSAKV